MPRVVIGVGSNVDREVNIRGGLMALRTRFGALSCSSVYRTKAVGFVGEDFFNLVVSLHCELAVQVLVNELKQIEDEHGRQRGAAKFTPRTLDLDLLLYGDAVGNVAGAVLPHPDILRYPFVLGPLAELAPDARHPILQRPYFELWQTRAADHAELVPIPDFLFAPPE
ncbi:MAG: 2-amino-4-hydroxy-6-hydroxymethyldihydropteridine diphosphokinase [Gammaproteobacteria bacterium]